MPQHDNRYQVRKAAVDSILQDRSESPENCATAFAPVNIALCKYWGKRDPILNLPVTSSLSVSLPPLGSTTEIRIGADRDDVTLNDEPITPQSAFASRVVDFLDLFRTARDLRFSVRTTNTVPTAAGLASSASGFAALTLALDRLFGWDLPPKQLSILARLGSGSASRSVARGFVEWHAGSATHGADSFAEALACTWPDLRVGVIDVDFGRKSQSSREAMQRTVDTSALYHSWAQKVADDLAEIRSALHAHDFERLGAAAESNALGMHATMLGARPPILYWLPGTVKAIHRVHQMREDGINVYLTIDAGPNVKILFTKNDMSAVQAAFPGLTVIAPFDPECPTLPTDSD